MAVLFAAQTAAHTRSLFAFRFSLALTNTYVYMNCYLLNSTAVTRPGIVAAVLEFATSVVALAVPLRFVVAWAVVTQKKQQSSFGCVFWYKSRR